MSNERTQQQEDDLRKLNEDLARIRAEKPHLFTEIAPSSIANAMLEEFMAASQKFGKFNSTHEGYAIILEELDEAWDDIKANNTHRAIQEIIQVGAMCIRFVHDLGYVPPPGPEHNAVSRPVEALIAEVPNHGDTF